MPIERFPAGFDPFERTIEPSTISRPPQPGDLARLLDNELYNDVVVTDAKNDRGVRARVKQRVEINSLIMIVANVDDLVYVVHTNTCGWSSSVLVELNLQGCA